MKKLLLNSLLVITIGSSAFSQSLKNTTWYVYDQSNILTYHFRFSSDSVFISNDFINYSALSTYTANGQTIYYIDVPAPGGCSPSDTGIYTFTVQNDTMVFNAIADVCLLRIDALLNFHWVRAETLLHNTFWDIYSPSNVLTYRFHYGTDIGYISSDLTTYYPLTNFFENGNEVMFNDINGAPLACPPADTGRYTFTIQNDTLLYTVLSETCTGRIPVLTVYHWVQNTTGIETQNAQQAIQLFPNPSADGIFNLRVNNKELEFDKLSVNTIQGKLILETIIAGHGFIERSVNLSGFPTGIYLLTLHGQQGNKVIKLVR
jgi:Secretion system C-terminal sorting domain